MIHQAMATLNEWLFLAPLSLLSGVTHGITVSATAWWLKSCGISYTTIGIFTICNMAYGFKILWVPLFDQINLAKLFARVGIKFKNPIQRKGFIVLCTYSASIFILLASFANPKASLLSLAIPVAIASFWSSNADAIMSAYVYETLKPSDMGLSTASYRSGFFAASALALFVHENMGLSWPGIFRIAAIVVVLLASSIFFAPVEKEAQVKTWKESYVLPYKDLIKTYGIGLAMIVLFMILYKLQDRLTNPMEQLFLRNECSLGSTGYFLLKFISTFALAFSAVKSGPLITKFGYKGSFGIAILGNAMIMICYYLQTTKSTLGYIGALVITSVLFITFTHYTSSGGKSKKLTWFVLPAGILCLLNLNLESSSLAFLSAYAIVIIAKMINGVKNSLIYSYQNALCSREYALTQITVMTSIESLLGGHFIQTLSGLCVEKFGWSGFYLICITMSLFPLIALGYTKYPIVRSK